MIGTIQSDRSALRSKLRTETPKYCNIYDTFHVSKLKPTTDDFFPNRPDAALPKPAKGSAEDIYEVEAILDRDFKYNVLYYLVHWKGLVIYIRQ